VSCPRRYDTLSRMRNGSELDERTQAHRRALRRGPGPAFNNDSDHAIAKITIPGREPSRLAALIGTWVREY